MTLPAGRVPKQLSMPSVDYLDPAVRSVMERVLADVPWSGVDDAVRRWFYFPPHNPGIVTVRQNANLIGLDLQVVPFDLRRALLRLEDRLWA